MISHSRFKHLGWPPAGIVPSSMVTLFASDAAHSAQYGTLSYANWTDYEPESSEVSLSGFGMVRSAQPRLGLWLKEEMHVESLHLLPLKAKSFGSWGWYYLKGANLQVYDVPTNTWVTVYTFPSDLSSNAGGTPCSAVLAPDGLRFFDTRVVKIPIKRRCLGLRISSTDMYLCLSTFAPTTV